MEAILRGPLLGEGRPAEVFAWGEAQVLKLYRAGWSAAEVNREGRLMQIAHAAGLPVPDVSEVLDVDGRTGIVCERIEGLSMQKAIEASPMAGARLASQLAELHARVHSLRATDLPSQRRWLENQIRAAVVLPEPARRRALAVLAEQPDGEALCHGDFHPDNILLTRHGPVIIDWFTATRGNPRADVANTRLLLHYGVPQGKPLSRLMEWGRRGFRWQYTRRYQQLRPGCGAEIAAWELPVLAAKLSELAPAEQSLVLARIERLLSRPFLKRAS